MALTTSPQLSSFGAVRIIARREIRETMTDWLKS